VEISILRIDTDGKREVFTRKINPTVPIPEEVSEIHGIYDVDVESAPTFEALAQQIYSFIENCDLGGYNSNKFDVPLLAEEFMRTGIPFSLTDRKLIDVQTIFHRMEQRTLSAAYKFYCDKELVDAHSAEADTLATFEILEAQLDKYSDLEANTTFLDEFSSRGKKQVDFAGRIVMGKNNEPVFNFGKFKGREVREIFKKEPGYYGWFMNADFPLYTKKVLKDIKESTQE